MDKKKTSDRKLIEQSLTTNDKQSLPNSSLKTKVTRRATASKLSNDKEVKTEEESLADDTTKTVSSSSKPSTIKPKRSAIESNMSLSSTPKSNKILSGDKMKAPINSFSTNLKNPSNSKLDKKPTTKSQNSITKSPNSAQSKKSISVIQWTNTLTNLENYIQENTKEKLKFSFGKIQSLIKIPFFQKLFIVKKEMRELLDMIKEPNETDSELNMIKLPSFNQAKNYYISVLNDTMNNWYDQIDSVNDFTDKSRSGSVSSSCDKLKMSNLSDDGLIDYINFKNNSVSFSIPMKRERAMSASSQVDLNSNTKTNKLQCSTRTRLTSEEIEKRMRIKLHNAEQIKQNQKLERVKNVNKLNTKIIDIKMRKKKEKKENLKRLVDKLEKYNFRHNQFLEEKTSKAKREQEKVAEIKFLNRMEKENRDLSIIKKLNISIERRESYMMQKFRKPNDKKVKLEILENVDNKIQNANKRKTQFGEEVDFLKSVYSENFIWELVQADYFDVDVLNNLTNITKFEILKAKLKKEKDLIDNLMKSKNKNISQSRTNNTESELEIESKQEDYSICSDDSDTKKPKRSKSFTFFDENDFQQVNYLFNDSTTKKKKRKKKKKPEKIKDKIIKSINSMNHTDFNLFFSKINKDKNIKKFLIRTKNGKYIKSKILVKNDDSNNPQINSQNENNLFNSNVDIPSSLPEDTEEKLIKNIMQHNSDAIMKNEISTFSNNTILINSQSLTDILEKNAITVKWCKLCNLILPNEVDTSTHIAKLEHKRLKNEYGISLQDDSTLIMVFQTLPGDISEDLKNERLNAIKLRAKKIKQKLSLRAVKHENFWSYKQDFPSNNKQRLQKISFDIEKQTLPNIKDYESLENSIKDLIKILEQKKQNDLHIMRSLKVIHYLVEILKKPAVCHKSEIKNLGKIIELVVKVLMYFSTLIENRNYMLVTNRMSTIVDLLLWVLNKPSKIPLGISFLPDLIYLITIHIKHRIPFEYLGMKDDFLEYLFLSNILVKFRQKFTSIVGPIDLTSGFGSFPLVLLKSLGMIEALTSQININYLSKPVYVKNTKLSENILFVLDYTELVGIVQLVSTMLLSNGPIKREKDSQGNSQKIPILPQTVVSATILGVKILNNIARLDLWMFQNACNNPLLAEQIFHILNYIINYSLEYAESSDDLKELLHETVLMMNYISLLNDKFQLIFSKGEVTLIQSISSLPFSYFCEKKLKDILFPTLISISYQSERNVEILNKEINLQMLIMFLKEKIQLEPIIEEEEKLDESREEINFAMMGISKDKFINSLTGPNEAVNLTTLKKRTLSFSSTASSSKSCHDMLTGVSDYIPLYHRFPRNLWEKTVEFYTSVFTGGK